MKRYADIKDDVWCTVYIKPAINKGITIIIIFNCFIERWRSDRPMLWFELRTVYITSEWEQHTVSILKDNAVYTKQSIDSMHRVLVIIARSHDLLLLLKSNI